MKNIVISTKFSKFRIFPCTESSKPCGVLFGKRKANPVLQMFGVFWEEDGFFWGKAKRYGVWLSGEHKVHVSIKELENGRWSYKYLYVCLFKIRIRLKISNLLKDCENENDTN